MRDFNRILFDKINSWQGKNPWLDAFGRAGAEYVIVGSLGWFGASTFINCWPDWRSALGPLLILGGAWIFAWCVDIGIALIIREPRPHISEPATNQLFKPMMSWKSFPSDHAMSAFLIFFVAVALGLPGAWALGVLALWVCFGRLYSGVHYPLDIIGGMCTAAVVTIWLKILLLFL
jgi:undecaprenyl-diphosphatase